MESSTADDPGSNITIEDVQNCLKQLAKILADTNPTEFAQPRIFLQWRADVCALLIHISQSWKRYVRDGKQQVLALRQTVDDVTERLRSSELQPSNIGNARARP
jgi:hypothetical protein